MDNSKENALPNKHYPTPPPMENCQCKARGSINLIVGPMFSGKTTELFRLCNRHTLAKRKVVIVKYARDTRYDEVMASTHDLRKMDAISALRLHDVLPNLLQHDVIGIDEGQFFDDIVKFAEYLADCGKTVIIAALDGDFRRQPFPCIAQLFSLAEKVEKVSAVCSYCGHSASFTLRTIRCEDTEVIGGEDMYQAVCRGCYHRVRDNQSSYDKKHALKSVNGQEMMSPAKRMAIAPHCVDENIAGEAIEREVGKVQRQAA